MTDALEAHVERLERDCYTIVRDAFDAFDTAIADMSQCIRWCCR